MRIDTLPVGPIRANCYILSFPPSREAVVIDPGDDAERIFRKLEDLDLRVEYILLTHGHFDHCLGVEELRKKTGGKIGLHEKDLKLYKTGGGGASFGLSLPEFPEPDMLISEGKDIPLAGQMIQVLHTPGHTEGHVCFYIPGEHTLFTGDLLFASGVGRTDLPGGSMEALYSSLKDKVLSLPGDTKVYPGHGPATTIEREKHGNPWL